MSYSVTEDPVIALTCTLIARASITPEDAGCQEYLAERLKAIGVTAKHCPINEVKNVWLTYGKGSPLMVFVGHTDVVPPGEGWSNDPFSPTIKNGLVYGRGVADMKGSIAAFVCALERLHQKNTPLDGQVALLLTSDEEGPAISGIRQAAPTLHQAGIFNQIDYVLVGEPSSTTALGDVIKIGRRGSLNATVKLFGKQGHIAYPHLADNSIHQALPLLSSWIHQSFDEGDEHFPPTQCQVSTIHAGIATNVIPPHIQWQCNWRFSPKTRAEEIQQWVADSLSGHTYEIHWQHSGDPFFFTPQRLAHAAKEAIIQHTHQTPVFSTSGGTSDGRFMAPYCKELIELGPLNATIHQADECLPVESLIQLSAIYETLIAKLLSHSPA